MQAGRKKAHKTSTRGDFSIGHERRLPRPLQSGEIGADHKGPNERIPAMRFVLLCALLLVSTAALADSPAALANPARSRAEASFHRFVEKWMQKVRALEQKHRGSPTVKSGSTRPLVTYRGYADEYSVELRPTGHARAPYVGLLHYTELVYSCESIEAKSCRIASSVPVTEIFRYQNGRWVY